MQDYAQQHRGDRGAYERYLAGMDASMRQKVALTAAHFLCEGRIADMGMGSGTGSHAFAALYPALTVIGVDISPEMVALARERHVLPNLSFVVGDVAARVFDPGSLDGVLSSSVLHHVTSFNSYDRDAAARAMAVQSAQLDTYGVLVVRDFLDSGRGPVILELPANDGDDASDDPAIASSARLFERFAREFRKLSEQPGFAYERLDDASDGFRRFRVEDTLSTEFLLRKDYRSDWDSEVLEEYTYLTQAGFEAVFASLGLRVLASTPIHNPWIIEHRLAGRARVTTLDGQRLPFPATNYLIAGEKVPPHEGVRFEEREHTEQLSFLELTHFECTVTGQVYDLAYRPHPTIDVVPFFELDGDVMVLARRSYPRPVLQGSEAAQSSLEGARPVGYVTEPLTTLRRELPLGQAAEALLSRDAQIAPERVLELFDGSQYYPSPGGLQEQVSSVFARVEPVFVEEPLGNVSGTSTSGRVRAISAEQVLRAAQVGGLPDARLELNVYALLSSILKRSVGPWIGDALELLSSPPPQNVIEAHSLAAGRRRRRFRAVGGERSSGFLGVRRGRFAELNAAGEVVSSVEREYVFPRTTSPSTVAVALLRRDGEQVYLGVFDHDLPAVQAFTGSSALWVAPAWRLPRGVSSQGAARDFVLERLAREHGIECRKCWELGGRYHPSPGLTPEAVYPLAIDVATEQPSDAPLHWVLLRDLLASDRPVLDGHLRIVAWRAAHAVGLLA